MIQILLPSTADAIINRAVGASGSDRHGGVGWVLRAGSLSTSAETVIWSSPTAVDPPIAYTDCSTAATAMPCRGDTMSGKPDQVLAIRSNVETLFENLPRRHAAEDHQRVPPRWLRRGHYEPSAMAATMSTHSRRVIRLDRGQVGAVRSADGIHQLPVRRRGQHLPGSRYRWAEGPGVAVEHLGGVQEGAFRIDAAHHHDSASRHGGGCGGPGPQQCGNCTQLPFDYPPNLIRGNVFASSLIQPPSTTGLPCQLTAIACDTATGKSSLRFHSSTAGS